VHLHRVRADVLPDGVARFLFVPMAEAVMFAMIASFILSRTLVPTMAMYLLRPHVAAHAERRARRAASRNPLVRFQRGFEARFERLRGGYRDLLALALRIAAAVRHRLPRLRRCSRSCCAVSRPQFLPLGRCRPDPDACAAPVGTRIEETANRSPRSRRRSADHPAAESADHRRQHRPADQRHQHDLQQHRHDRPQDGDIQISLNEGHAPTADYVRRCASSCRALSRRDLLVPARRHRQPDPEFRRAGADRPAGPRNDLAANFAYANKLLRADPPRPGVADARIQQSRRNPLNVDVDRTRAQYVG
jgi:hypothetical protein